MRADGVAVDGAHEYPLVGHKRAQVAAGPRCEQRILAVEGKHMRAEGERKSVQRWAEEQVT